MERYTAPPQRVATSTVAAEEEVAVRYSKSTRPGYSKFFTPSRALMGRDRRERWWARSMDICTALLREVARLATAQGAVELFIKWIYWEMSRFSTHSTEYEAAHLWTSPFYMHATGILMAQHHQVVLQTRGQFSGWV